MTILRLAALLFALSSLAFAQNPHAARYSTWKSTALVAGPEVVTIQQPATGSRRVTLELANIYCSVACVVEIERDGTAATGTTNAIVALSSFGTATATAWHTSDVGNGTTILEVNIAAGETKSLNLEGLVMQGDGTGKNFSFRTDSITGDAEIYIRWREE